MATDVHGAAIIIGRRGVHAATATEILFAAVVQVVGEARAGCYRRLLAAAAVARLAMNVAVSSSLADADARARPAR